MTNTWGGRELPVLLYTRVARPDEDPNGQVRALEAFAAERGWTTTGTLAETEPWGPSQAAIDALRAAPAVLTWDLTRLGRNGEQALSVYNALAEAGVRVFFASGGQGAVSPARDALMRTIIEALEQAERRQHSERVRYGLARRREARA